MPGFGNTMKEFKKGDLHSGSKTGPVVKNKAQAEAIALSEERAAGKKVPPPPQHHQHGGTQHLDNHEHHQHGQTTYGK